MNFNSTIFVVFTQQIGHSAKVYAHKGGRVAVTARPGAISRINRQEYPG
jgi:hypothetical protein